MKLLICTMGRPRSGKSTWCEEQLKKGYPVVCPDTIRLALHGKPMDWKREATVWTIAKTMVKYFFEQGYKVVIFDATNYRCKNRREPKKWAKEIGCDIKFKVFDVTREVCIERALTNGREDLIPVIERQSELWTPLNESEKAFDETL